MKKIFLLAATAFMITGVAMADNGKKKKKCVKGKTCCAKSDKAEKSCCKEHSKTAKI